MNSIATWCVATAVGAIIAFHPQVSASQTFRGAEFAAWTRAQQDNYIQISVTMAGIVASQIKPQVATCIDTWYAPTSGATKAERNKAIISAIGDNAEYHPSAVIYAMLENACGSLK